MASNAENAKQNSKNMSVDPDSIEKRQRTVSRSELKLEDGDEPLENVAEIDSEILEKL